jgi:hypothetical protein
VLQETSVAGCVIYLRVTLTPYQSKPNNTFLGRDSNPKPSAYYVGMYLVQGILGYNLIVLSFLLGDSPASVV